MKTITQLNHFVASYLETAIWAELSGTQQNLPVTKQAKQAATEDCKTFADKVFAEFTVNEAEGILNQSGNDLSHLAAHDLWLTRNGHGAGFWDKDIYNDLAVDACTRLTNIAKSMGTSHIYANKGRIYID